jgi:hypothetical protein
VSRLSIVCASLDASQSYKLPWAVTGIDLPLLKKNLRKIRKIVKRVTAVVFEVTVQEIGRRDTINNLY